jgi:hypothetical protein
MAHLELASENEQLALKQGAQEMNSFGMFTNLVARFQQ